MLKIGCTLIKELGAVGRWGRYWSKERLEAQLQLNDEYVAHEKMHSE